MFVAGTGGFLVVAPFAFGGCALEGSAAVAGAEELEVFDDDGDMKSLSRLVTASGFLARRAIRDSRG